MGRHVNSLSGRHFVGGKGRHRAEDPASPVNTGLVARTGQGFRSKLAHMVVASGALALVTASASPAAAPAVEPVHEEAPVETGLVDIVVPVGKHVAFDRVDVRTEPAPPPPIVQEPREVEQNIVRPEADVAKYPAVPAPAPPARAPVIQAPPVFATVSGAAIAAAALAQLGRRQDCTMLVTNALAAVGITHHGWPVSYLALGTRVDAAAAQPGDLIYYVNGGMGLAHIAVYIGNGVAVHGGWDGFNTVTFKANIGSGPVFIRVNGA